MFLTKKLTDFFSENKGKPKNEVVELMMKEFNYKKSTAMSRYSDYSDESISFKKIVFDFFKNNPYALEDSDNKIHSKELKIPIVTYAVYKSQYKAEQKKQKLLATRREKGIKDKPKYGEQYYKGKLRQKFAFDDSKLFG